MKVVNADKMLAADKEIRESTSDQLQDAFKNPKFRSIGLESDGQVIVKWDAERIGFGEITIMVMSDGSLTVYAETMGRDFVRAAMNALVDKMNIVE